MYYFHSLPLGTKFEIINGKVWGTRCRDSMPSEKHVLRFRLIYQIERLVPTVSNNLEAPVASFAFILNENIREK